LVNGKPTRNILKKNIQRDKIEKENITNEELIELLNKPLTIETESFGTITFEQFVDQDFDFIQKANEEKITPEQFCKEFLSMKVTSPKLSLDQIDDLSSSEICEILKKYIQIESLESYFIFKDYDYEEIMEGFNNFRLNYINTFVKTVVPDLTSRLSQVVTIYNNSIQPVLETIPKINYEYYKVSDTINTLIENNIQTQYYLHKLVNSCVFNITSIINPIINSWYEWSKTSENLTRILTETITKWNYIEKESRISKIKAQEYLKRYHWFISPNMDYKIVIDIVNISESDSKDKLKQINHTFINYFLEDNCKQLEDLIEKWRENSLFDGRIKILQDCVNVIKICNGENINFSNLVVPTLIAQIEGIQTEFMKQQGLTVNRNKICDLEGELKKDENNQDIQFDDFFRELTSHDEFFDAMNDIFLNVLFQRTQPGEDYKSSIHFSRHKILHGENKYYGKKVYTIRCFMILDFLSELRNII